MKQKCNENLRKLVVGFGNLFDSITLYRFKPDLKESERFIVPIAYASKERATHLGYYFIQRT